MIEISVRSYLSFVLLLEWPNLGFRRKTWKMSRTLMTLKSTWLVPVVDETLDAELAGILGLFGVIAGSGAVPPSEMEF